MAARMAVIGIVSIHAVTMLPATPHRIPESRRVAPTPMIAELIVCVVDTGACRPIAITYNTLDAVMSAATPRAGSS